VNGRSFDDRVRNLVRKQDAAANPARPARPETTPFNAPVAELVARTLATPMPRRRAVGLMAGALLAGSAWRPGRARAATCTGAFPKKCTHSGGAEVCTTADGSCCETKNCIVGCKGCETCAGGTCSDTPKMCGHPDCGFPDKNARPKFCFVEGTVTYFCTDNKPVQQVSGWCCRAGEVCPPTTPDRFGDCICRGEVCGETLCCDPGEVCESSFFGDRNGCVKKCPDGKARCRGSECCTGDLVCTSDGCACPSGTVQRGVGKCVPPKEDPGDPRWHPIDNLLNMMGATSASHGGSRLMIARPSQTGSSAVDSALVAIAAVNGQATAAQLAFNSGKRDPAFRRKVRPARIRVPRVSAGAGLDAASAAAISKWLAAEAKAWALAAASAKALWRARAAKVKGQRGFARSQLRQSAKFAGEAATALKRVQALRTAAANALTAGGVAEVTPTAVSAFAAAVRNACTRLSAVAASPANFADRRS